MISTIDQIIFVALSMLAFVPSSNIGNLFRLAILGIAFFIVYLRSDKNYSRKIFIICVCMVISPFIPSLFVLLEEHTINTGLIAHELMRMVFCAVLILTVSKLKVSFNTVFISCLILLSVNLIIQLLQYFDNEAVFTFISNYYVEDADSWSHLDLARGEGLNFRSGSIFINPNVYMVIPLFSMVIFLQRDIQRPSYINHLFVVFAALSCILTGSRTATAVMFVIIIIYFAKFSDKRMRPILLLALLLLALVYGEFLIENSRAFQFEPDQTSSLSVKLKGFVWFWKTAWFNPIYWISGALGSSKAISIDSEIGHIYSWYGLFGIIWYVGYIKQILKQNRQFRFYSIILAIVSVLVAFTASVLLCMPIYSFIGAVLFSNINFQQPTKGRLKA